MADRHGGGGHGRGQGGRGYEGGNPGNNPGYQGHGGARGRGRGRGGGGGGGGGYGYDKFAGEQQVFKPGGLPSPDIAITNLEDKLVKKLAQSTEKSLFPRRPAFGTEGIKVVLWANYYKLTVPKHKALLKYSLTVEWKAREETGQSKGDKKEPKRPPGPKGQKLHTIIKTALDQVGKSVPYATEFKDQVISLEPFVLPENATVFVSYNNEGRNDVYEVKFNGPVTIELSRLLEFVNSMVDPAKDSQTKFEDVIDAISIITGHFARSNACVSAQGRSRYFPLELERGDAHKKEHRDLDRADFNQLIRGYFQSARPATGRMILNVNVAHGIFRPRGPLEILMKKYDLRYPETLNKALSKLRARCTLLSPDRDAKKARQVQKLIYGLADKRDGSNGPNPPKVDRLGATALEVRFFIRGQVPKGLTPDSYCTVSDYYKKKYGYSVKTDLPVVNVGNKANPVYMPAELINIIDGQFVKHKITPDETRAMIEFSCRSPFANATSISDYGRTVLGLDVKTDALGKFGFQVDRSLLTVHGRELAAPSIMYAGGQSQKRILVHDGEWNMENVRVIKPGRRINKWFWMYFDGDGASSRPSPPKEIKSAMDIWIQFMQKQGISIADSAIEPNGVKVTLPRNQGAIPELVKIVFERMKSKNAEFVFVILPGRKTDTGIYNEVKKLTDRHYGYHSQHILMSNLMKRNSQIFANLGLKVNLKMGGINHKLDRDIPIVKKQPTMIVGYDVTHPTNLGSENLNLPSLVGMVASVDSELGQWPATIWAQSGGVEMLNEVLEDRFADRIKLFRERNNNQLPVNIIIFRDGVSEGQFAEVLEKELPHIREACKRVYPATISPRITLIVSVKRHQTRFYPTDPNHMIKSSRNVKCGTVVDRGVTQASTWDFFLTAHKGIQGTSRAAHYTVLHDEVFRHFSPDKAADQLEKLTYHMCYLFQRATKAVSICPPAYYADIVCTRARVYLSDMFDGANAIDAKRSMGAEKEKDKAGAIIAVDVHDALRNSMFYI